MSALIPKLNQNDAYARSRLQGTVWERADWARVAYAALNSVGAALGRLGVSPNAITWFSLVLAVGSALALVNGALAFAGLLLTASGVCDALDGAVARATGRSTRFGALLDSTIDRVADALPLAAMMVYFADRPLQTLVPAAAMIGAFVVPYVRARAEALGVLLPPLFMRRPERMVLVVLSLLLGTLPLAGRLPEALMLGGVGILALLSFAGAASALRAASNELDPEASRDSESIGQNLPSEPVTASGP